MTLTAEERRAREVLVIDENFSRGTDPNTVGRIPGWSAPEDHYGTGWWLDYNNKKTGAASLHITGDLNISEQTPRFPMGGIPTRRFAVEITHKSTGIHPGFLFKLEGENQWGSEIHDGLIDWAEQGTPDEWKITRFFLNRNYLAEHGVEDFFFFFFFTTVEGEASTPDDWAKIDRVRVWAINHNGPVDMEELAGVDETDSDGNVLQPGQEIEPNNPENNTPVHSFTRTWWDSLPEYIRAADRQQDPPVPLLRFLDGAGRQAGAVRDTNTGLWDGTLLNPNTAPPRLIPWIAYLLGFTATQRDTPPELLRAHLQRHIAEGSPGVGTREVIANAVRPHIRQGGQVQILASPTYQHTLIIGISPDDVPDQNYSRLARQVRASGVVPAGHALLVQDIRTTWDAWEAYAGETWAEKERNIPDWGTSDSAGATFE